MTESDGQPFISRTIAAYYQPLALAPEIARLGRAVLTRRDRHGIHWHRHPEFEIHYLAEGILEWRLDRGEPIVLRAGDIYLTRPGQEHSSYDVILHRSTLFWVAFDPDLAFASLDPRTRQRWRDTLTACAGRIIHADPVLRRHFDDLVDEVLSPSEESDVLIRSSMQAVIATTFRSWQRRESPAPARGEHSPIAKALALMQDTVERPLAIAAIARRVGLSRSGMHAGFVAERGLSPNETYVHLRMQRAKALLLDGMPPVRVAAQLGYSSAVHFGAAFRRTTGVPPGRWREAQREAAGAALLS